MTEPTSPHPTGAKPFYKRWWFIALAVVVVLGAIGSLGDTPEEVASSTTLVAAPTTSTTDSPGTSIAEPTTSSSTTASTVASTSTPAETTTTPPPTTTTAPPTTTTPPTTSAPEVEAAFADGTWIVGDEISPGLYQTRGEASFCYWERLSGLGGTFEEIIANATVVGQGIVEIQDGDEAFSAQGCGAWTVLTALDQPLTSFGDGWWALGDHIAPGRYRATGGELCYWERLSGFSGEFDDIISNEIAEGQALVEISSSDAGFHAQDCGIFEPVG